MNFAPPNAAQRIAIAAALAVGLGAGLSAETVKALSHAQAVKAAVTKPAPVYPPMGKSLRLEGSVELHAYISEAGTVEKVETLSGNPILVRSATEAVKRWKFTPFTDDGKPVKATAVMTFDFKL